MIEKIYERMVYKMNIGFLFFTNSVLLGVGLAMDAFSVSLANGLNEPHMRRRKMCLVAGIFAAFQWAMPMAGWICVSSIVDCFSAFQKWIPWIALILLCYIGGHMLIEGIKNKDGHGEKPAVGMAALLIQGVATSIDALSVGFTISDYNFMEALLACTIIGIVTYIICLAGLKIGKKAGTKLTNKAEILGGSILIFIGIEIFIKGII